MLMFAFQLTPQDSTAQHRNNLGMTEAMERGSEGLRVSNRLARGVGRLRRFVGINIIVFTNSEMGREDARNTTCFVISSCFGGRRALALVEAEHEADTRIWNVEC
jgi:hypothetical protein